MNRIDGKSVQRGEPSTGSTREADVGLVAGFRIGIGNACVQVRRVGPVMRPVCRSPIETK